MFVGAFEWRRVSGRWTLGVLMHRLWAPPNHTACGSACCIAASHPRRCAAFCAVPRCRCDTRSALEAEGYSAWMTGLLLVERESDWAAALGKLVRAK